MSRPLRAAVFYLALTLLMTWPMATRLHILDAGDSAFFAWEIAWEIHALATDVRALPHGNIFHPLRYTLAMDEPILGTTLLVLPLSLFTDDAVWLFNVARLMTFWLAALAAYLLAREMECGEGPSLAAGIGFGFSMITMDQLAHLSTLGTQWLPLVVLFTYRYSRSGRMRDAFLAGLFYVLETLACGYHGLIGAIVLPLAALPLVWGRWTLVARALPVIVATAVALLPLYALHNAGLSPQSYVRGVDETVHYSASIETFFATSSWNRAYGAVAAPLRTAGNALFPGLVHIVGVLIAAAVLLRRRQAPSRAALCLAVMVVAAAVVALGPEIRLFGRTLAVGPFQWLREALPFFQMIRVPSRAGAFVALGLSVLFARALHAWPLRPAALAGVMLLLVLERLMIPIPLPEWAQVIDSRRPPPAVYRWLAEQPGDFALVELPILDITGVFRRPAFHESIYMVRSTHHWKRLLNGYAGIEPAHYVDLREKARRFPSAESIAAFRALGATYVIVHRGGYGPFQWRRIARDLPAFAADLEAVGEHDGSHVFRLRGPANDAGPPASVAVDP